MGRAKTKEPGNWNTLEWINGEEHTRGNLSSSLQMGLLLLLPRLSLLDSQLEPWHPNHVLCASHALFHLSHAFISLCFPLDISIHCVFSSLILSTAVPN